MSELIDINQKQKRALKKRILKNTFTLNKQNNFIFDKIKSLNLNKYRTLKM